LNFGLLKNAHWQVYSSFFEKRKQVLLPLGRLGAWVGDWRVQRLLGRGTYSKV
jgi:hypothetical protein